jgi:alkylmercury lyase
MTPPTTTAELDATLAAALPSISEEVKRLARRVARLLAEGEPLDTERIASVLGRPQPEVGAAIAALPWVVRDDRDRVVGFWGLAVIETPHRLRVAGRDLYAFCAMDALYLPFLLGETIGIESTCPTTGQPITLTASPEGLADVSPAGAAVSVLIPAEGLGGDATQVIKNACHFIHFFASDQAAREWTSQHDGALVVSIQHAFELAARTLARRLVAVDR